MALSLFLLSQEAQLGEPGSDAGAADLQVAGGGGDVQVLVPDGSEGGVFEGIAGTASSAVASSRGQGSGPGSVVGGHWSMTLVTVPGHRLVPNPLDRFLVNSHSPLVNVRSMWRKVKALGGMR